MNHLNIIIMSLFHCFLAFANPWQAVLIGIMTTYSFLETKKYKKLFLFFSWLSIFFLPLVLFFLINSDESFHSHYLGLKKNRGFFSIYSRFLHCFNNKQAGFTLNFTYCHKLNLVEKFICFKGFDFVFYSFTSSFCTSWLYPTKLSPTYSF